MGNVLPELTIGHQIEELQELMNSATADLQLKVFSGYAGWSPGQLDNELRQKSWLTTPADLHQIFKIPLRTSGRPFSASDPSGRNGFWRRLPTTSPPTDRGTDPPLLCAAARGRGLSSNSARRRGWALVRVSLPQPQSSLQRWTAPGRKSG